MQPKYRSVLIGYYLNVIVIPLSDLLQKLLILILHIIVGLADSLMHTLSLGLFKNINTDMMDI